MHLTPEQFVEIIDGERAAASLPHLAECGTCRDQLATMRATMHMAVDVEVPEPAPFFWDRLSANVRDRIDVESSQHAGWRGWFRPSLLGPVATVAAVVLVAILLAPRVRHDAPTAAHVASASVAGESSASESGSDSIDANDPLLTLVADLSSNMDVDAAADAGFSEPDSAEHAVTHMSREELRALREILQKELGQPGA